MDPAINDFYRVIFASWYDGQYGLNIRYYKVTAIGGLGLDEPTIAQAFFLNFGILYQPLMNDDSVFLGCSIRNLTRVPAAAAVQSTGAGLTGTGGATPLPSQVTGIITLRSAFAGRSNRGRIYIPFPAAEANDADSDRPSGTYVTDAQVLGDNLASDFVPGVDPDTVTMVPVVKVADLPSLSPITSGVARQAWATQRRRGDYGARNPQTIPQ